MNKPFTIQVQETEQKIVEDINNSQLPAYVLKTILQNIYKQLEELETQEIQKYKEETEKENKKEDKESDK